jgi:hypothetical protein
MRKFLAAAAVVAVCLTPFTAAAIPAFSRQTGIDCQACHQQHMPILNDFGQAFKASGYRTMGRQPKVESENLSIPDTLNGSMLLKGGFQRSNGGDGPGAIPGGTSNGGQWHYPERLGLFFGGRIASNIGFFFEGSTAKSTLVSAFKLPTAIELSGYNLALIPYVTDTMGASYGYEQASTGAVRNVIWAEHRRDISAQQYVGTDGAATGIALVMINNNLGYLNISRWAPAALAKSGSAQVLHSTYVRIAATPMIESPTVGDWAFHIGAQVWSGSNYAPDMANALQPVSTRAMALDFQAFGRLFDKDVALYATWAKSPGGTAALPNILNVGRAKDDLADLAQYRINDRSAFTVGVDYSLIQDTLHVGAAVRSGRNGGNTGASAVAGENPGDNALTLTAVYNLAQNIELHANHSFRYGSLYTTAQPTGNLLTTISLLAAW